VTRPHQVPEALNGAFGPASLATVRDISTAAERAAATAPASSDPRKGSACRLRAMSALIAGLLVSTVATAQADWTWPLQAPTLRVGDSWTFRITDLFTGRAQEQSAELRVHACKDDTCTLRGRHADGRAWNFTADRDFNSVYTVRGERQVNRSFQWPLALDVRWRNDRRWMTDDALVESQESCEVVGQEVVEVPAGRFETAKVRCRATWSNDRQRSGNWEVTRWYAPAAKLWVRIEERSWVGSQLHSQWRRELLTLNLAAVDGP
jgi:hypothetical protein